MSKKIVILLLIIFIGSLSFPFLTLAGEYQGYGGTVHYEGLVPCGKSEKGPGESDEVTNPCEFCHLFVMLDGIIDFVLFNILPPVVVLMMVIAGIMFFFAGGNPTLLLQAKKLITSVVIGVVIIFSAYLIIGTVLTVVGVQSWTTLDTWLDDGVFIIDCPIGGGGSGGNGGNGNGGNENGGNENGGNENGGGGEAPASDYTTKDECIEAGYYWYDEECHEEEEKGEWVSVSTDSSADNIKELTLGCPEGTKLDGEGQCNPGTWTNVSKTEPYGDNGWYCKFKGERGGPAEGELSIYCIPE